ncbi:hypothetical protein DICPUDRAFT_94872 [Dictyostelium purpureum]|uniref:Reticulon-like protein n=1 Tax=Dictyostelium purpureum TaxID=5786 RepID=F0ZPJ7_DICPU|nr:uncharacterized protein DICPUDRAFT_94872 [Dictyostelium purpureum]EGC34145.1 hypothetical protein DICPUDRAFT_94872 [Dictyostelium purpureum]|eukprot:XP_003289343.1 hypothetical protein DICPUDRAFT_94872 [Dictyostelium purpureum]
MNDNKEVQEEIQENVDEVKENVDEVKETVEAKVEEVKEDINKLKDDVKGVAESVSNTISSKVEATTSSAKAAINEIKNEVKQAVSGNAGCPYSMNGEFSICGQVCKLSKVVQKNPSFECVKKIVLWEDLIQSGLLFAIINVVFFLVTFSNYSLFSLFGYTAFTFTITSILFNIISIVLIRHVQGVKLDNPFTDQLKTLSFHVHEAVIEKQVNNIGEIVNTILGIAKDIFGCKSLYLSAQFAVVFYLIGRVSKCLSNTGVLYVVFLASFLLPKLYVEKKELIDQQCAKISALIKEPLSKLHTFIPNSQPTTTSKKSN